MLTDPTLPAEREGRPVKADMGDNNNLEGKKKRKNQIEPCPIQDIPIGHPRHHPDEYNFDGDVSVCDSYDN